MAFLDAILTVLLFIWDLIKTWLSIFIAPLKKLEILWIIVPIWVNWFFTEFFQEKKGTSLGNAVTNGGIMIWVGVDWLRYIIRLMSEGSIRFGFITLLKFVLALIAAGIGIFIVIEGVKAKRFVHFVGRVRETTYILVMISPIIYGIIPLSWKVFAVIIIFAPAFYYLIELIDQLTPTPKTYEEKEEIKLPGTEKTSSELPRSGKL